jgi:hypothetical protein
VSLGQRRIEGCAGRDGHDGSSFPPYLHITSLASVGFGFAGPLPRFDRM